jgi:molybdopterin adenylyltransferase
MAHGERVAAVLTVSDGVAEGARRDDSGPAVARSLEVAGFAVARREAVPDEAGAIRAAISELAGEAALVVTTGGTGLGPRDVTPEATRSVIEREVPGLAEAMRAAGRASTPMADLSRGLAGDLGGSLVLNLPGSERGAVESLDAVLPAIPHALELLAGRTVHGPAAPAPGAGDVLAELARRRGMGQDLVLATAVRVNGDPPCRPGQKLLLSAEGGPLGGTLGCAEFDGGAAADAPAVLRGGEPALRTYEHELGSVEVYLEPHRRRPLLVVLGATPVALWLLRWAVDIGYDTALVEPRADRITAEHKDAAGAVAAAPEELSLDGEIEAVHTDHDAPGLVDQVAALMRAGARFMGVMGSRRHAGPHLEALRDEGLEVGAVRTPVGLDIGARSSPEIALSILAGLVAARAGASGGWLDR